MKKILIYGLSSCWGGREAIIMNVATMLKDEFFIDVVKDCSYCDYENRFCDKNLRFIYIPAWGQGIKKFETALKKVITNNNYDYVWINASVFANSSIINIVKKYSKAKIITHSHGSNVEEPNTLKAILIRILHYLNRNR